MNDALNLQLDYAPAAPIRRRKRIRRAILFFLLIAVAYPAYRYGPPAYRQAKLLYLQRRCLNYTAPADRVVYDQESATTASRAQMAGYSALALPIIYGGATRSVALGAAAFTADEATDFSAYFPAGTFFGATVFMHERVSKTGVRRLVVIRRGMVGNDYPFYYVFGMNVQLIDQGTYNSLPKSVFPNRMMQPIDWMSPLTPPPTKGLRFYAGQIDPADTAHFTIRYELGGKQGTIDGRLSDAGNDVILRVMDGPALKTEWVTQVLP